MQVLVQNPLSAGMFLFLNKVSYLWRCSGLRLLGRPVERRMFCWLFLKSVWGDTKWKCYWTWTHMADWHISSNRSSTKTKVKTLMFPKRRKEKPSLVSNLTTVLALVSDNFQKTLWTSWHPFLTEQRKEEKVKGSCPLWCTAGLFFCMCVHFSISYLLSSDDRISLAPCRVHTD